MSNNPSKKADEHALSRRNMLVGTSTLVAATMPTSGAFAQARKAAPAPAAPSGRTPNILVIFGDVK